MTCTPAGRRMAGASHSSAGERKMTAAIAILSLAGGEARIITDLPKGAAGPVWSPDSKRIAFMSSTTPEDIEKEQRKKNDAKAGGATTGANTKESAAPGSRMAA